MSFYHFDDGDILLVVGTVSHKVHRDLIGIDSLDFWPSKLVLKTALDTKTRNLQVLRLLNLSEIEVEYFLDAVYSPTL